MEPGKVGGGMVTCWMYQRFLADYLEGSLWRYAQAPVRRHVGKCVSCQDELERLRDVGALLRHMPSPAIPEDLAFQVRYRLCRERGRRQQPSWRWRWANVVAPFAVPVTAGALSALLLFAILIPMFGTPVRADSSDVPLTLWSPPRFRGSGPIRIDSHLEGMVVQLLIDEQGRVADCYIVTGALTREDVRLLQNLLAFAVFDPATVFGTPTPYTVVLPSGSLRSRN